MIESCSASVTMFFCRINWKIDESEINRSQKLFSYRFIRHFDCNIFFSGTFSWLYIINCVKLVSYAINTSFRVLITSSWFNTGYIIVTFTFNTDQLDVKCTHVKEPNETEWIEIQISNYFYRIVLSAFIN